MLVRKPSRFCWALVGLGVVFSGCAAAGDDAGEQAREASAYDGGDTPDPGCLAICGAKELPCAGVDTEGATLTVTQTTASGCSGLVTFNVSGTLKVTIDCTSKKVCIDEGGGGCVGSAGMCYPAEFNSRGFSYSLPDCIQGSLSCWMGAK